MSGSWGASMRSAVASALARPDWWAIALAGFLVRGGLVIVILPIVSLPSSARLTTTLAPPLEALILGRPSLEGVILGTIVIGIVLAALVLAGIAGSWLDLALAREAAEDDELELTWRPVRRSSAHTFWIRLTAHLPTFVALGYGTVRLVGATYAELLSPGDPTLPVAARVIQRAPDAVAVVVVAWLIGEALGGLAFRRVAAGEPVGRAFRRSIRQLGGTGGLATLALTSLVLLAVTVPFLLAVGRAWLHVRSSLLGGADAVQLGSAVLLLAASWVLGLAVLGAALAWRATAWSVQVGAAEPAEPEPAAVPAPEVAAG